MTQHHSAGASRSTGRLLGLFMAVLVGSVLTAVAFHRVADRESDCVGFGSSRLVSAAVAGTPERFERAINCEQPVGGPTIERGAGVARPDDEALKADYWLIGAYTATLAVACYLGSVFSRRRVTRRIGLHLAVVAVVAGVLDVGENLLLHAALSTSSDSKWVTGFLAATATTKFVAIALAAVYGIAAALGAAVLLGRRALGRAAMPEFLPLTDDDRLATHHADRRLDGPLEEPRRERFDQRGLEPAELGRVGISLSGGGIRSASFSLGALQQLHKRGVLQDATYVSSVSGGGYTAMAWQIASHWNAEHDLGAEVPPLDPESPESRYLEREARYLWPPLIDERSALRPHHRPSEPQKLRSTGYFVTVVLSAFRGIVFNVALLSAMVFLASRGIGWVASEYFTDGTPPFRPQSWWQLVALAAQAIVVGAVLWPSVANRPGMEPAPDDATPRSRWARFSWPTLGWSAGLSVTGMTLLWYVLLDDQPGLIAGWNDAWWMIISGLIVAGVLAVATNLRSIEVSYPLAVAAVGVVKLWTDGFVGHADRGGGPEVPLVELVVVLRVAMAMLVFVVLASLLRLVMTPRAFAVGMSPRVESILMTTAATILPAVALAGLVLAVADLSRWPVVIAATGAATLAAWAGLVTRRDLRRNQRSNIGATRLAGPNVNRIRTMVGLFVSIAGAVSVVALAARAHLPGRWRAAELSRTEVILAGVLVVYAFVDQKWWSPHQLYKRRLATTFSPIRSGDDSPEHGRARPLPMWVRTSLDAWAAPVRGGPKLLVCAAAYDTTRLRARGTQAVPFVFECDHVGSADLGLARTRDYVAVLGRRNAADATLQAATAISGAAVSAAIGAVRLGSLSQAISLLNLRLGVWLPSPEYVSDLRRAADGEERHRWIRIRRFPYLLRELANRYDTDDRFVYVTDGGQFENLGLYELMARHCSTMYAFDASGDGTPSDSTADPRFSVASVLHTMRLAHERLGVRFARPGGPAIMAEPAHLESAWLSAIFSGPLVAGSRSTELRRWVVSSPVVAFDVIYPPGSPVKRGRVIFGKARPFVDEQLSSEVTSYLRIDRDFPSNSTIDQFMDPEQYRAYVMLGQRVAARALSLASRLDRAVGAVPDPVSPNDDLDDLDEPDFNVDLVEPDDLATRPG